MTEDEPYHIIRHNKALKLTVLAPLVDKGTNGRHYKVQK